MCLLHIAAASAPSAGALTVATFDHRTGAHSRRAFDLVRGEAASLGVPVVLGQRRAQGRASEAELRQARWAFLKSKARALGATVVTAHTADDQLETIVMRVLRGCSARGLAGLLARAPGVARPLLGATRQALAAYASQHQLRWEDDPSNTDLRYFRNRIRHELLPALTAVRPTLPNELNLLSQQAADLRRRVDSLVERYVLAPERAVKASILSELGEAGRALAWPALLAPMGVVLDRRGVGRLAHMDAAARPGYSLQLSGEIEAVRLHDRVAISRAVKVVPPRVEIGGEEVRFGGFRFHRALGDEAARPSSAWELEVSNDRTLTVRAWEFGDRIAQPGTRGAGRRVSRCLSDAGVVGPFRRGWPVVVSDGEIVWVPGICRTSAATARSGRPVRRLICERIDR